jgi:ankyrin repeat domain-containing protein 50
LITSSRSNVLDHITSQLAMCKEVGICFAYYNYQSLDMQDLSHIISALIKQLCQKTENIPDGFLRLKHDSRHPSAVGNQDSFVTIAQDFKEVFLVIDGLDECPREKRPLVLGFISGVVDTLPRAKVFVTSRPEPDIMRAFARPATSRIEVRAKSVAADILKYVEDETKRLHDGYNGKKLYVQSKALEQKIVATLTEKAEGM